MTALLSQDHADDRADVLAVHGLNGIRLALVKLPPGPNPDHAELTLLFYNDLHLAVLAGAANVDQVFRLRGGARLIAGRATGQVQ